MVGYELTIIDGEDKISQKERQRKKHYHGVLKQSEKKVQVALLNMILLFSKFRLLSNFYSYLGLFLDSTYSTSPVVSGILFKVGEQN